MSYTKKDFKVYGENPVIDSCDETEKGSLYYFSDRGFFDYENIGNDPYLRNFRWLKLGDGVDDEVEVFVDTTVDIRDYNINGELNEMSYSDFHDLIKNEYPALLNDNSKEWTLMSTTVIEDSGTMFRTHEYAFFDVVDNDIVVRVVSVRRKLVKSDKTLSGFDVEFEVEDVLFMTVRKRPSVYIYDTEKGVFVKKTKAEVMNGIGEDFNSTCTINSLFNFVLAETIVNGHDINESLKRALVVQGDYAKHENLIDFLILPPFTNLSKIDGGASYAVDVSLNSLYVDAAALYNYLEVELNSQSVIDMVTRLGFYLKVDTFKRTLENHGIKDVDPDLSIEELLDVDHYLVENLAYFVNYNYESKTKNTEKAEDFMTLLSTAKRLLGFGVDVDVIVDNLDKLYSIFDFELQSLFNSSPFKFMMNKFGIGEHVENKVKNRAVLRIIEASNERFIDMSVAMKMYNKFVFEVKVEDELYDTFRKLDAEEAFDFILPMDIQLELNKLGYYGDGY